MLVGTECVLCDVVCRSELEAQVQDLREVCKSSAADRAAAATHRPSPEVESLSPRSSIQLPTSGPVVIPGSLVNLMERDSSPQTTTEQNASAATS